MMQNNPVSEILLGREADLKATWDALDNQGAVLVGPRRIGKTEMLKHMVLHPRAGWFAVRIDLEGLDSIEAAVDRIEEDLVAAGLGRNALVELVDQVTGVEVAGVGVTREKDAVGDPWLRLDSLLSVALRVLPDEQALALLFDEVPWWLDGIRNAGGVTGARVALARLRQLRQSDALRGRLAMVLTGSVGLSTLARELGASAEINDLVPLGLGPLDRAAGEALFEAELAGRGQTCTLEAAAHAHEEAGGSPHWLKLVASRIDVSGAAGVAHVERALDSLTGVRLRHLFADEGREHLQRRHGASRARIMRAVLDAAAAAAVVESHVLISAALAAESGAGRDVAEEIVFLLVDEYYLDEVDSGFRFVNPLFRRWWRKYEIRR